MLAAACIASCTVPDGDPERATLSGLIRQLDGRDGGDLADDFPTTLPGVAWARSELEGHASTKPRPSLLERMAAESERSAKNAIEDADAWFRRREAEARTATREEEARLARSAESQGAKLPANDAQARKLIESSEANVARLDRLEARLSDLATRSSRGDEADHPNDIVTRKDWLDLRASLDDATRRLDAMRSEAAALPALPNAQGANMAKAIDAQREALEAQQRALEAIQRRFDTLFERIAGSSASADALANFAAAFEAQVKDLSERLTKNDAGRNEELTLLRRELGDAISGFVTASRGEGATTRRAADLLPTFANDLAAIRRRLAQSESRAELARENLLTSVDDLRKQLASPPAGVEANVAGLGERLDALARAITDKDARRTKELSDLTAALDARTAELEKERKATAEALTATMQRFDAGLAAWSRELESTSKDRKADMAELRRELAALVPGAKGAVASQPPMTLAPMSSLNADLVAIKARLEASENLAAAGRREVGERLDALRKGLAEPASGAALPENIVQRLDARLIAMADEFEKRDLAMRAELGEFRRRIDEAEKAEAARLVAAVKSDKEASDKLLARLDDLRDGFAKLKAAPVDAEASRALVDLDTRFRETTGRLEAAARSIEAAVKSAPNTVAQPGAPTATEASTAEEVAKLRKAYEASEASVAKEREALGLDLQRLRKLVEEAGAVVKAGQPSGGEPASVAKFADKFAERFDALTKSVTDQDARRGRDFETWRKDVEAREQAAAEQAAKAMAAFEQRFDAAIRGLDTKLVASTEKRSSDLEALRRELADAVKSFSSEGVAKSSGGASEVPTKAILAEFEGLRERLQASQAAAEATRLELGKSLAELRATTVGPRASEKARVDLIARLDALDSRLALKDDRVSTDFAKFAATLAEREAAAKKLIEESQRAVLARVDELRNEVFAKLEARQSELAKLVSDDARASDLSKRIDDLRKDASTLKDVRAEFAAFGAKADDRSRAVTAKVEELRAELVTTIDERQKELITKIANDAKTAQISESVAALRSDLDKRLQDQAKLLVDRLDGLETKRREDFEKRLAAFEAGAAKSEQKSEERFAKLQSEVTKNLDGQRNVFEQLWKERSTQMAEEKERELAREDALARRLGEIEKAMKERFDLQQRSISAKLEEVSDPGPILIDRFTKLQDQGAVLAKALESMHKEVADLKVTNPSAAVASLDARVAAVQTELATRFEAQRSDFARRLAEAVKPSDDMRTRVDALIEQSVGLTRRIDSMNARIAELQVSKLTGAGGAAGADAVKSALAPLTTSLRDDVVARFEEQNRAFRKELADQKQAFEKKIDAEREALLGAIAKRDTGSASDSALVKQLNELETRLRQERKAFTDALDQKHDEVSKSLEQRLEALVAKASPGGVPGVAREIEDLRKQLERAELERARNRKDMILRLDALGSSLSVLRSNLSMATPLFGDAAKRDDNTKASDKGPASAGNEAQPAVDMTRSPSVERPTSGNKGDTSPREVKGGTRIDDAASRARPPEQRVPPELGGSGADVPAWQRWLPWGLGTLALFLLMFLLFRSEKPEAVPAHSARSEMATVAPRVVEPAGSANAQRPKLEIVNRDAVPPRTNPEPSAAEVPPNADAQLAAVIDDAFGAEDAFVIDPEDFDPLALDPTAFGTPRPSDASSEAPPASLSVSVLAGGILGSPRLQSLRLRENEVSKGAVAAVQRYLTKDRRVLVEPKAQVEERADGSLSIRFYVTGDLGDKDIADLIEGCRKHAR